MSHQKLCQTSNRHSQEAPRPLTKLFFKRKTDGQKDPWGVRDGCVMGKKKRPPRHAPGRRAVQRATRRMPLCTILAAGRGSGGRACPSPRPLLAHGRPGQVRMCGHGQSVPLHEPPR